MQPVALEPQETSTATMVSLEKPKHHNWYHELVLENRGLVARDHMANERTVLLWIRTGMMFVLFGIMFAQFYRMDVLLTGLTARPSTFEGRQREIQRISKPVGGMCCILGFITLVFGYWRYMHVQYLLRDDYFPATRLLPVIVITINVAILLLLLALDIKMTIDYPVV